MGQRGPLAASMMPVTAISAMRLVSCRPVSPYSSVKAAGGMLRRRCRLPGHGSFRAILAVGVLVGRSHS